MRKSQSFIIQGMNRDMSASKLDPKYAYEIKNMRIFPTTENTLMSMVNEKGNKRAILDIKEYIGEKDEEGNPIYIHSTHIEGVPIGQAVLNDTLVLFCCGEDDIIYSLELTDDGSSDFTGLILYKGDLNFHIENPIETLVYYENAELQKVYWTDGLNQPRVINITADDDKRFAWDNTQFDFVREMNLEESVIIERNVNGAGLFAPGTIQYVFTYFDKYMQETNPFYISPLLYTSHIDRGGSPEESVSNSFDIWISDIDTRFDYVRIYSILRTSVNAVPECKKVIDLLTSDINTSRIFFEFEELLDKIDRWILDEGYSYEDLNKYVHFYNHSKGTIQSITEFEEETSKGVSKIEITDDYTAFWLDRSVYSKIIFGEDYPNYETNSKVSYVQWEGISGGSRLDGARIVIYKNDNIQFLNSIYKIGKADDTTGETYSPIAIGSLTGYKSGLLFYSDNGATGESIDPTELLYVGGQAVTFNTMTQKDNTLFLGDINLQQHRLSKNIKTGFRDSKITFSYKDISVPEPKGYYPYENQLSLKSTDIKTFKYLETYRFGLIFQHKTGAWSDVAWINDNRVEIPIRDTFYSSENTGLIQAELSFTWKEGTTEYDLIQELIEEGFIRVKPVIVYPSVVERECICQGVLCPTLFNMGDRYKNSPFVQSSWFVRPNIPFDYSTYYTFSTQSGGNGNGELTGGKDALIHTAAAQPWDNIDNSDISNPQYSEQGILLNGYYNTSNPNIDVDNYEYGSWLEFRHNFAIPNCLNKRAEIQCITQSIPGNNLVFVSFGSSNLSGLNNFVDNYSQNYFIDQSILTLHSPDIEFDDQIQTYNFEGAKLRIVGMVPLTAFASDLDIQTSTPPSNYHKDYNDGPKWNDQTKIQWSTETAPGFYFEKVGVENGFYKDDDNPGTSHFGYRCLASGPYWFDEESHLSAKNGNQTTTAFVVYPWHRSGSLNNCPGPDEDGYQESLLQTKKLSNLRFSYKTQYFNIDTIWNAYVENSTIHTGIADAQIFNSEEILLTRLKAPENSTLPNLNYYGNSDKLLTITPSTENTENSQDTDDEDQSYNDDHPLNARGYPIVGTARKILSLYDAWGSTLQDKYSSYHKMLIRDYQTLFGIDGREHHEGESKHYLRSEYCYGTNPVRIKYKSTPHIVLDLNYSADGGQVTLPALENLNIAIYSKKDNYYPYWNREGTSEILQDSLSPCDYNGNKIVGDINKQGEATVLQYGWLWLGELYRDNVLNRFGGDSEEALEYNTWEACGESVSLNNPILDEEGNFTIKWTEGDTYYQRYDHIKTYPFTLEDENSVTDIISFMCETRVNLDGRYDRNRGQTSNLAITPENFNQVNFVYSQENNFFTYHTLNENLINLDNFHNSLTWTKTKVAGDLVDTWTNITLASTLDLDGDKGSVRALERFNNQILAFQDTGISQIKYNENVQLASTEGVPVELANSGKVDGKDYLTNQLGCTNKWTVRETPNGLYFIDNITKGIYIYNGQFTNITDNGGFSTWITTELQDTTDWNSVDFGDFVTYYGKINSDVMFINKDTCLAFSEVLGGFSSFYDYEDTPYMVNVKDKFISIRKDNTDDTDDTYYLWFQNEGDYNVFFGEYKPFWLTVIANDGMITDKTFDNIEFRADTFKGDDYQPDETFDYLEARNEYQYGNVPLWDSKGHPAWIKKKFKIWRAIIPRDRENRRDRIRSPWAYITLSKRSEDTNKTILHDMQVVYYDNTPIGLQTQQPQE